MKIGIDLRQLVLGASGGLSQHMQGVCEQLFALYPEHEFLVFCTAFNRSLLNYEAGHVRYFSLPVASYFKDMDRIIAEEQMQVLFRAYPMEDTLQFPLDRQIIFIPDNQHETYPQFFSAEALRTRRVAFGNALSRAGAIGTNSEFTRAALLSFPETRCEDIFLMGPALQTAHAGAQGPGALSDSERALIPQEDFFLFPANLWQHKNHRGLLQAFQRFLQTTGYNVRLILTGHPEGWPELAREFPGIPATHLGFVRPEMLRALFERARALVFFSLYEGFGIPLLEAFDAGTPVLCSNTTSLPEVGGDAVLACDPTDSAAMADLMARILADDGLRQTLIERGRERLKTYSWAESAHRLMAACARVAAATTLPAEPRLDLREPLPLVSIVTPSYNQGRFIRRTIDSVLSQSYLNIEYQVVDGGSTDETVEILRSYGERLRWVSEPDQGQADAINKGLAQTSGEIRAYLNSDDTLAPGAIERVVHFFQEHPECDLVYGDADYIDADDKVTGRYKTAEYSLDKLAADCIICQPAAFWRRRMAERVGPFDAALHYVMDYDYWLRIAQAGGNIQFLPIKLAHSRLYAETKTLSGRAKIFKETFEVCRRHLGYVHRLHYRGYLHHLTYERRNPLSLLLRILTSLYIRSRQVWRQRGRYSFAELAPFAFIKVARRLGRLGLPVGLLGAALWRKLATAGRLQRPLSAAYGFLPDNWLEPLVMVAPKTHASGQILHVIGIPAADLVMTVYAGEKEICRYEGKARQLLKAYFPADAAGSETIGLHFSSFVKDAYGRRLALLLQDTNLFNEADIP